MRSENRDERLLPLSAFEPEIRANRRVDFDTTVAAMALTAREMNAKYKETSEGGLAVSLVLC
jgi:L-serine dehydratase